MEIREATVDPFEFFHWEVSDATPLDTDPWDKAWEAVINGEVVGMLAVELHARTPNLVRLAVKKDWRREGVATALIDVAKGERDEWYTYVDEDNEACQEFLASQGFEEGGWAPPPNLERWTWPSE